MNKSFLFGIIASVSLLFSEGDEKIRISPSEVHVNDQGVFIHLNGQWIPVEIFRDSRELSIKPMYQTISYGFIWQCNCNTWNFGSDVTCRTCGRGRYDYSEGNGR